MTRAWFADTVIDPDGKPIRSVTVDVYNAGTTTPISGTIYAAPSGGTTLSNPFLTNTEGELEFWLDAPLRVDLKYSKTGEVTETHTVDVMAAAHDHIGTYAPSGGADIRTYGALTAAADNGPAINLAIAALPAAGGNIYVPPGTWNYTTPIDLDDKDSITFWGNSAPTAGGAMPSQLVYTAGDSASAISAKNTFGVQFKNLALRYSHASYTGILVDYRNLDASDTAFALVDNCYIGSTGSGAIGAAALVAFDKAIDSVVRGCHFDRAAVGVLGKSADASYSNGIQITSCIFHRSTSKHIKNPGQSWLIQGCIFESLNDGTAGAIGHDAGVTAEALLVQGCWTGDSTGGSQFVLSGNSLCIQGNWIGATGGTCVEMDETVIGLMIIGNEFRGADNGIKTIQPSGDSLSVGWLVHGNSYVGVTTRRLGNYAEGTFAHDGLVQSDSTGLTTYGIRINGQTVIVNGNNIRLGQGTGTKIGTNVLEKLGFWNTTPVVQPAGTDQVRTALRNMGLLPSAGTNPLAVVDADVLTPLSPTKVVDYRPTGVLAQTVHRRTPLANRSLLTSGQQGFARIWLEAGTIVTNIVFLSATTALVSGNHQWFSLYNDSLGKLAVTADDTSTAWGANALKSLAVSSPYTITVSGYYRLGIMIDAATPVSLMAVVQNSNGVLGALAPIEFGLDATNTGLTTPATAPATAAALSATQPVPYAHIT